MHCLSCSRTGAALENTESNTHGQSREAGNTGNTTHKKKTNKTRTQHNVLDTTIRKQQQIM